LLSVFEGVSVVNTLFSRLQEAPKTQPNLSQPSRVPFSGFVTNKIVSSLNGSDFARLLSHFEPVTFATGSYIHELGQPTPFVYFPETAVISQLYYLEDGSSAGVSIIGNDGLLGLSALLGAPRARNWALATIGGTCLRIRLDELKSEFMKSGTLQKLIFAYTDARLSQLSQRTVCNTRHRLEERLCTWLLMIHDRTNSSELPLTHEAISQHLGTRRAGVTNFCNALRDDRVISYHRAMITILDRAALEATACECYRRVK
jgi:CRP-like cAMP-binding protein